MTRGRCGSLLLQRMKLSFTTPCRFYRRTGKSMKKLAERTVPAKRKQALVQAKPIRCKHSQSEIIPQSFPRGLQLICAETRTIDSCPSKHLKSLNSFNSPGDEPVCIAKIGTPPPLFFQQVSESKHVT
jgi:hypothetical protein